MPDEEIVAVLVGEEDQKIGTLLMTLPFASFTTPLACVSSPILSVDAFVVIEIMRTVGVGAVAVNIAVPVLPSELAVIVTAPALSAVTSPAPSTEATDASDDTHVTVRPVSTVP